MARAKRPCAEQSGRLSREDLASALNLTTEQAEVLDLIAAGKPVAGKVPGIREVTQAIALKASFSAVKPKSEDAGEGASVVIVREPYAAYEICETCPHNRKATPAA